MAPLCEMHHAGTAPRRTAPVSVGCTFPGIWDEDDSV